MEFVQENLAEFIQNHYIRKSINYLICLQITNIIQPSSQQVKDDISKFKMESVDLENERKKILGELEEKLETTNTLKGAYDLKYDGTMKTLDQLKSGTRLESGGIFVFIGH